MRQCVKASLTPGISGYLWLSWSLSARAAGPTTPFANRPCGRVRAALGNRRSRTLWARRPRVQPHDAAWLRSKTGSTPRGLGDGSGVSRGARIQCGGQTFPGRTLPEGAEPTRASAHMRSKMRRASRHLLAREVVVEARLGVAREERLLALFAERRVVAKSLRCPCAIEIPYKAHPQTPQEVVALLTISAHVRVLRRV